MNCLDGLKLLEDNSIDCCVTSPPYWGLRDYGNDAQIGMEEIPDKFVQSLVDVFTEVKRVLKPEGTLWLNLGDTYSAHKDCKSVSDSLRVGTGSEDANVIEKGKSHSRNSKMLKSVGLKNKDLIGIPWMVAFALRSSGWYLRQDIIWSKPNPMPESVRDRCTKSHEYIFLMSKSQKYYYDQEAIKTEIKDDSVKRMLRGVSDNHKNINGAPGQTPHSMNKARENVKKIRPNGISRDRLLDYDSKEKQLRPKTVRGGYSSEHELPEPNGMANKKSVWTVTTKPFSDAHFATFPEELIVDCIKAGCPEGGIVLDPFMGAGTTAMVARKLNRNYIGFELNPEYIKIAEKRLYKSLGVFL